ncbi:hypothetical protein BJ508DRAFT_343710 [Ascobolus immersus RN42]|uniref:Uncharacterized protein n=1 Tax=Ascobolus immersus RN42 TaxID=1160509 RepID=A0A3N4IA34_ASCIM|nr:hypothetical protein BJ508DRAFT_343710 [Ascobolus immersus RN42]
MVSELQTVSIGTPHQPQIVEYLSLKTYPQFLRTSPPKATPFAHERHVPSPATQRWLPRQRKGRWKQRTAFGFGRFWVGGRLPNEEGTKEASGPPPLGPAPGPPQQEGAAGAATTTTEEPGGKVVLLRNWVKANYEWVNTGLFCLIALFHILGHTVAVGGEISDQILARFDSYANFVAAQTGVRTVVVMVLRYRIKYGTEREILQKLEQLHISINERFVAGEETNRRNIEASLGSTLTRFTIAITSGYESITRSVTTSVTEMLTTTIPHLISTAMHRDVVPPMLQHIQATINAKLDTLPILFKNGILQDLLPLIEQKIQTTIEATMELRQTAITQSLTSAIQETITRCLRDPLRTVCQTFAESQRHTTQSILNTFSDRDNLAHQSLLRSIHGEFEQLRHDLIGSTDESTNTEAPSEHQSQTTTVVSILHNHAAHLDTSVRQAIKEEFEASQPASVACHWSCTEENGSSQATLIRALDRAHVVEDGLKDRLENLEQERRELREKVERIEEEVKSVRVEKEQMERDAEARAEAARLEIEELKAEKAALETELEGFRA